MIVNKFDIECIAAGNDTMMKIYVVDYSKTKEIEEFISNKTGLYHKSFQVMPIEKNPRNETGKVIYKNLD